MIHFSYSFCLTLLHSLWQAALLMGLYFVANRLLHKNNAPLARRNLLYLTLAAQLFISICTFCIYYFNTQTSGLFTIISQNLLLVGNNAAIQYAAPWIFVLYVLVLISKLVKAVFTWRFFFHQYKNGITKPAIDLKLYTQQKAHQFGIKRKVTLWLSTTITTPVTFGFFKPVILLPVVLVNNISLQQAETLILHELSHIRTNDYLLNWFLLFSETVFFFNPFIKNICRQIRLQRELNCDLQVIAFEYSPALYAETLLQAEKMKKFVPAFQLAAANNKKHLLKRIEFFSNKKAVAGNMRFNLMAPLAGIVLVLLLILAMLLQNGNNSLPFHSARYIPFLPVNNYSVTDADFAHQNNFTIDAPKKKTQDLAETGSTKIINNVIASVSSKEKTNKKPVANKDFDRQQVEPFVAPVMESSIAVPVTTKENDAARQIIVKEEGSGGTLLKVYYLIFEDGKWILQPQWMITAKEINKDSLKNSADSIRAIFNKPYPSQQ